MFLNLGSIANIDQHEIIFPMASNIVIFEKKNFMKFGLLPWQPAQNEL